MIRVPPSIRSLRTTLPFRIPADNQTALSLEIGSPFGGSTLDVFPLRQIITVLNFDSIPALTNPAFLEPSQVQYLAEDDLVLGLAINGEAKAYPHNIGWWHEIINDVVGGQPVSVTFCPLTGTGLVFDATDENGEQFSLGVSGKLYNNNLVMYDRRDRTLYPQIYFTGVWGGRENQSLTLLPVIETTWAAWKQMYPETTVVKEGIYGLPVLAVSLWFLSDRR